MALSLDHLTLKLGARRVLEEVSVTLAPGRVTAILGPNGAGKSSLLRAVAALVAPASGQVLLDGANVMALDPRERARRIGYLPQGGTAAWNIRARDLVALGRLPHRAPFAAPSPADAAAIGRALAATDTAAFAGRPVGELSGGERARVLLARVLAGEPDWLLADEPLAALDPAHQLDLLDRLREQTEQERGVAIVLHDLLHAGRIADDVLLLREGRVLAFGAAAEVMTAARLRAAFDIDVEVTLDSAGRPRCIARGR